MDRKVLQNKYEIFLKNKLGSGSFAEVYKGVHLQTGEELAVKQVNKQNMKRYGEDILKALGSEVTILQKISYSIDTPFIVKIFDCFETENNIYMVLEYCNQGTLYDILKKKKKLPEKDAAHIIYQVICAVELLSINDIAHRDIKPENIFVKDNVFKLGDFGFASQKDLFRTTLGTYPYMAPEIFKGGSYTTAVDNWAIGVMYHELIFGDLFFIGKSHQEVAVNVKNKAYVISKPNEISKESQDFLMKCMEKDPNKRLTIAEMKNHPLFENIRKKPIFTPPLSLVRGNTSTDSKSPTISPKSSPRIISGNNQPNPNSISPRISANNNNNNNKSNIGQNISNIGNIFPGGIQVPQNGYNPLNNNIGLGVAPIVMNAGGQPNQQFPQNFINNNSNNNNNNQIPQWQQGFQPLTGINNISQANTGNGTIPFNNNGQIYNSPFNALGMGQYGIQNYGYAGQQNNLPVFPQVGAPQLGGQYGGPQMGIAQTQPGAFSQQPAIINDISKEPVNDFSMIRNNNNNEPTNQGFSGEAKSNQFGNNATPQDPSLSMNNRATPNSQSKIRMEETPGNPELAVLKPVEDNRIVVDIGHEDEVLLYQIMNHRNIILFLVELTEKLEEFSEECRFCIFYLLKYSAIQMSNFITKVKELKISCVPMGINCSEQVWRRFTESPLHGKLVAKLTDDLNQIQQALEAKMNQLLSFLAENYQEKFATLKILISGDLSLEMKGLYKEELEEKINHFALRADFEGDSENRKKLLCLAYELFLCLEVDTLNFNSFSLEIYKSKREILSAADFKICLDKRNYRIFMK